MSGQPDDGLGSTRALTDETGAVTDTYDYSAYGQLIDSTGSTGEQFDSSLDNYYLRARYYDPSIGRFTQQDTWMGVNRDPVTLHKYAYGNLDPINHTDPTGNFSMGSMMSAINIASTLVTTAQTIQSAFKMASGSEEVSAREIGSHVIAGLLGRGAGKVIGLFGKKIASKCNNSFAEGTMVKSEEGYTRIEDVEIG